MIKIIDVETGNAQEVDICSTYHFHFVLALMSALGSKKIQTIIEGQEIEKIIVTPKIVNIVTKDKKTVEFSNGG